MESCLAISKPTSRRPIYRARSTSRASIAGSRCDVGESRATSPAQPSFLHRTLHLTSPDNRSWSTAVTPRVFDACPYRKSDPHIMVMQSAEDRQRKNAADRLD